jgi:tRNA pseudouridine32 synthase/23S rRNA pseudouridine746 synthase
MPIEPRPTPPPIPAQGDLRIVHATDRYVVIDKPAGLLSVPGKGPSNQDCAASRVRAHFPHATGPIVVHRLDMDTSGLLLLALDPDAQRDLSAQFEARTVAKAYTALLAGVLPAETGRIDLPMRADITRRPLQIIDHNLGRDSSTAWRVLALETDRTRVELVPFTGRTHQLRVHCAAIGHPILGDVLYGPQPETAAGAPRLCLHANSLTFRPPGEAGAVTLTSRAPF